MRDRSKIRLVVSVVPLFAGTRPTTSPDGDLIDTDIRSDTGFIMEGIDIAAQLAAVYIGYRRTAGFGNRSPHVMVARLTFVVDSGANANAADGRYMVEDTVRAAGTRRGCRCWYRLRCK